MRLFHGLLITAMAVVTSGCLNDLVPLHQPDVSIDGGVQSPGNQQQQQQQQNSGGGGDVDLGTALVDDAGGGGSVDGGAPDSSCIARTAAITDGHHNPGLDCLTCHNGTNAIAFTVAGTLFDAVTGGAAVAGATIELTQAGGATLKIITSTNGNFYSEQAITYPVNARASGCPADQKMSAAVAQSGASCNSCHKGALQIHLP